MDKNWFDMGEETKIQKPEQNNAEIEEITEEGFLESAKAQQEAVPEYKTVEEAATEEKDFFKENANYFAAFLTSSGYILLTRTKSGLLYTMTGSDFVISGSGYLKETELDLYGEAKELLDQKNETIKEAFPYKELLLNITAANKETLAAGKEAKPAQNTEKAKPAQEYENWFA